MLAISRPAASTTRTTTCRALPNPRLLNPMSQPTPCDERVTFSTVNLACWLRLSARCATPKARHAMAAEATAMTTEITATGAVPDSAGIVLVSRPRSSSTTIDAPVAGRQGDCLTRAACPATILRSWGMPGERKPSASIPLRRTPEVKRGNHGAPTCQHGTWTFAGANYKRRATQWRCPTGECSPKSKWVKADRLRPLVPRDTRRWRDLYYGRSAVEREFGRLKHEYGLSPLRVRGLARVQLHADLTMLARLSQALARARAVPLAA
jgi:hypothetical protein